MRKDAQISGHEAEVAEAIRANYRQRAGTIAFDYLLSGCSAQDAAKRTIGNLGTIHTIYSFRGLRIPLPDTDTVLDYMDGFTGNEFGYTFRTDQQDGYAEVSATKLRKFSGRMGLKLYAKNANGHGNSHVEFVFDRNGYKNFFPATLRTIAERMYDADQSVLCGTEKEQKIANTVRLLRYMGNEQQVVERLAPYMLDKKKTGEAMADMVPFVRFETDGDMGNNLRVAQALRKITGNGMSLSNARNMLERSFRNPEEFLDFYRGFSRKKKCVYKPEEFLDSLAPHMAKRYAEKERARADKARVKAIELAESRASATRLYLPLEEAFASEGLLGAGVEPLPVEKRPNVLQRGLNRYLENREIRREAKYNKAEARIIAEMEEPFDPFEGERQEKEPETNHGFNSKRVEASLAAAGEIPMGLGHDAPDAAATFDYKLDRASRAVLRNYGLGGTRRKIGKRFADYDDRGFQEYAESRIFYSEINEPSPEGKVKTNLGKEYASVISRVMELYDSGLAPYQIAKRMRKEGAHVGKALDVYKILTSAQKAGMDVLPAIRSRDYRAGKYIRDMTVAEVETIDDVPEDVVVAEPLPAAEKKGPGRAAIALKKFSDNLSDARDGAASFVARNRKAVAYTAAGLGIAAFGINYYLNHDSAPTKAARPASGYVSSGAAARAAVDPEAPKVIPREQQVALASMLPTSLEGLRNVLSRPDSLDGMRFGGWEPDSSKWMNFSLDKGDGYGVILPSGKSTGDGSIAGVKQHGQWHWGSPGDRLGHGGDIEAAAIGYKNSKGNFIARGSVRFPLPRSGI